MKGISEISLSEMDIRVTVKSPSQTSFNRFISFVDPNKVCMYKHRNPYWTPQRRFPAPQSKLGTLVQPSMPSTSRNSTPSPKKP